MDRLIASNSVPLAQADTAPTTGTPQYATDGNPATNVPATLWPAYAFNALQDEIYNVIVGAGLTPNRAAWNQLLAAIQTLIGQPQTNKVSGVVGQARNLFITAAANSTTSTLTADELIVESALGGLRYCLSNLNLTGNLSTQMDTGSAPVSGYVAKYVIFNPAAALSGTNPRILYSNATSAKAANVYSGANMPSGYTASALVSVLPTNGSGNFGQTVQRDRRIVRPQVTVLSTSTTQASFTALSIASAVPLNAVSCGGQYQISSTASAATVMQLAADATGSGLIGSAATTSSALTVGSAFANLFIETAQTIYYNASNSAGTPNFTISISQYEI